LEWLLPLLPKAHHYCEPFAGSGAVLLNRESSPVETYNDIDGDVVNFFKMLRDKPRDLVRAISLTPFSREEYYQAINGSSHGLSAVERARRFYIRARQTRTGLAQTAAVGELQKYEQGGNVRCGFPMGEWKPWARGHCCEAVAGSN